MVTSAMKAIIFFSLLQASVAVCDANSDSCNVEEQPEMMKQLDVEEPSLNMLQTKARQASNTAIASAEIQKNEATKSTPDEAETTYYGFDEAGNYVGTEAGAEEVKEGDEAAEVPEASSMANDDKQGDEAAEVPEVMAKDDSIAPLSAVQTMAGEEGVLYDNASGFPEAYQGSPVQWYQVQTSETANAEAFCAKQDGNWGGPHYPNGRYLCTYEEICPYGIGFTTDGYNWFNRVANARGAWSYPHPKDEWVPYLGDGGNAWVEVGKWTWQHVCGANCGPKGTTNQGTTCVKHHDLWHGHYGKPAWGTTPDQVASIRNWIACCEALPPPCVDYWGGRRGQYDQCNKRQYDASAGKNVGGHCCKGGTVPEARTSWAPAVNGHKYVQYLPLQMHHGYRWTRSKDGSSREGLCCVQNYVAMEKGFKCKSTGQVKPILGYAGVWVHEDDQDTVCKDVCDSDPSCTGIQYTRAQSSTQCYTYHHPLSKTEPGMQTPEAPLSTCWVKKDAVPRVMPPPRTANAKIVKAGEVHVGVSHLDR